MTEKSQFCPLLKKECLREKCAWWRVDMAYDGKKEMLKDYGSCVIHFLEPTWSSE